MNGYFEVLKLRAKEGLLKIVPDLSSETLLQIIQGYVRPNSIIVTDCWRAYSSLQDLEFTHYTVNYSYLRNPFVSIIISKVHLFILLNIFHSNSC